MSIVVMKFGGAAVVSAGQFSKIAAIIETRLKNFSHVLVVISAMGRTTDALLALAAQVHPHPPKREQDMLITVGERVSSSLLAMALDLKGVQAISFTGSQAGVITTNDHSDAQILEVRPFRVIQELNKGKVVIVAGFQGVSLAKEVTTLGRGGSDTSAVALAVALGAARVEFYKDVGGIGEKNPKIDPETSIYPTLSFDAALEIIEHGAKVLHRRCLEMAKRHGIRLEIRSFNDPERVGTTIHKEEMAHV